MTPLLKCADTEGLDISSCIRVTDPRAALMEPKKVYMKDPHPHDPVYPKWSGFPFATFGYDEHREPSNEQKANCVRILVNNWNQQRADEIKEVVTKAIRTELNNSEYNANREYWMGRIRHDVRQHMISIRAGRTGYYRRNDRTPVQP